MGYQGNYPPSTPLNPTQLGTGVVTTDAIANGAVIPADLSTGGPYWDTSGNVGIGTASPGAKLDVNGVLVSRSNIQSLASVGYVQAVSTTNAAVMQLISDGNAGYVQADGTSAIPMLFRIQGAEKMRLDTSGNVGIGTSSPVGIAGTKLDVRGSITAGQATVGRVSLEQGISTNSGYVAFWDSTLTTRQGYIGYATLAGSGAMNIFSDNATNALIFGTNSAERMRIDSSGNVGIGTSSPGQKLDVAGNMLMSGQSTADQYIRIGSGRSGNGYSFIDLQGDTTYSNGMRLIRANGGANSASSIEHRGTGNLQLVTQEAAPIVFYINGTSNERMRIDSSSISAQTRLVGNGGLNVATTVRTSQSGLGSVWAESPNSTYMPFMTFHRPGAYAAYFGLDNDNWFAVGGWSAGNGLANFKAAAISKSSGSFTIDHPIPEMSETHNLVHSFIEGPQADLIYRGRITLEAGKATVNVDTASGMTDGTFVLLCRDVQCYTSNETGWTPVRGSIVGNILTIEAEDSTCTDTISWLVIGERQDKHMYDTPWTDEIGKVIVEPLKNSAAAKSEVEV